MPDFITDICETFAHKQTVIFMLSVPKRAIFRPSLISYTHPVTSLATCLPLVEWRSSGSTFYRWLEWRTFGVPVRPDYHWSEWCSSRYLILLTLTIVNRYPGERHSNQWLTGTLANVLVWVTYIGVYVNHLLEWRSSVYMFITIG